MEGKAKTFALVGLLVLLLGAAAYMWWPEPAPKLPPEMAPNMTDQPPPAPKPGQPNEPDAPAPKKGPPIISG